MSIAACAEITQRGDPTRFRFAMAAPVAARRVLFPLYAFNIEVSRAPWVTEEAMIAEMRLQWWRDALQEIAEGAKVRAHEVTTPLAEVLSPGDARALDALVAARRWDIYKDPFEDAGHFQEYLISTTGRLMAVAARVLAPEASSEKAAEDAGYALGLANWFLAIPDLEARGRLPLVDGRPDAIKALASEALSRLARARKAGTPRAAAPAFFPASSAQGILLSALKDPSKVGRGTLEPSPASARARALWCSLTGRW